MNPLSIECDGHFTKHGRGRKELESGIEPSAPTPGRVLRGPCWGAGIPLGAVGADGRLGPDYAEARPGWAT